MPALSLAADPPNDAFIAGYAAAVLEREFSVKSTGLAVHDGHVTFPATAVGPGERAQLLKSLGAIPGVRDITLTDVDAPNTGPALTPEERVQVNPSSTPTTPKTSFGDGVPTTAPSAVDGGVALTTDDQPLKLWLGPGRTFSPILADPRWPHLFASYNHYDVDKADTRLSDVGSVGFGETISFLRWDTGHDLRQEVGIQGGLFAIFDLDSDSADLINADYFVGPYYALRFRNFSMLARIYHQSSHLGDEYLLRAEHEERVNYSYETFNLLASYDLPYGFRVYGGAGYLFDVDPGSVRKLTFEYGAEWTDPQTLPGVSWARPVVAFDGTSRHETDYDFSYSIRAGLQLEDPTRFTQKLQIMLEYYDGDSPNGQFYQDHIRFYGIGAHFYF